VEIKKILSDLESPSKLREKSDASEAFKLTLCLIGLIIVFISKTNKNNVFLKINYIKSKIFL
jgi:hypothetical protein